MSNNEELKQKYGMLTDTWKLYRKYSNVQDTNEYWDSLVNESRAVSKKYGQCKFIIDLVLAVINEFERVYKKMRNDSG